MRKEIQKSDIVFHLAAAVGVFNVVNYPAETIKNNIEITEALLRFARGTNTKGSDFLNLRSIRKID